MRKEHSEVEKLKIQRKVPGGFRWSTCFRTAECLGPCSLGRWLHIGPSLPKPEIPCCECSVWRDAPIAFDSVGKTQLWTKRHVLVTCYWLLILPVMDMHNKVTPVYNFETYRWKWNWFDWSDNSYWYKKKISSGSPFFLMCPLRTWSFLEWARCTYIFTKKQKVRSSLRCHRQDFIIMNYYEQWF